MSVRFVEHKSGQKILESYYIVCRFHSGKDYERRIVFIDRQGVLVHAARYIRDTILDRCHITVYVYI